MSTNAEPIAPSVASLLNLFESELPTQKFPGLDREVLNSSAALVQERHSALCQLEAAVEEARAALAEAQEQLLAKAQRAHAYARVFAEDEPGLLAKVDAIAFPRGRKAETSPAVAADATVRRRGRPPKKESAPLFLHEPIEGLRTAHGGDQLIT